MEGDVTADAMFHIQQNAAQKYGVYERNKPLISLSILTAIFHVNLG